jgi:hypothetical protein
MAVKFWQWNNGIEEMIPNKDCQVPIHTLIKAFESEIWALKQRDIRHKTDEMHSR